MRLESGGVTAWSECVSDPDPFYSYETNATARHIIKDFLLPLVETGHHARRAGGALPPRARPRHGQGDDRERPASILIAKQKGVAAPRAARPAGEEDPVRAEHRPAGHAGRPAEGGRTRGREGVPPRQDEDQRRARTSTGSAPCAIASRRCPLMVDANGDYSLADADHLEAARRVQPDDGRAAAVVQRHHRARDAAARDDRRRSASTSRSTASPTRRRPSRSAPAASST